MDANLETLTIENYLVGCVTYDVTDEALRSIIFDRGVEAGSDVSTLPIKERELCKADLYVWCSLQPSQSSVVEDADANWKHKEGGQSITKAERSRLIRMANAIYSKYGEPLYRYNNTIRVMSFGMKVW